MEKEDNVEVGKVYVVRLKGEDRIARVRVDRRGDWVGWVGTDLDRSEEIRFVEEQIRKPWFAQGKRGCVMKDDEQDETIRRLVTRALGLGDGCGDVGLSWREIVGAIYDLRGEISHLRWLAASAMATESGRGPVAEQMYVDEGAEKIVDDLVREVQAGLQSRPVKGEVK